MNELSGAQSSQNAWAAAANKAVKLANVGRYEDALQILAAASSSAPEIKNAKAVCLMRLGQHTAAAQILRSLVMLPGCTWMKPELPVIYRTNFATALLLSNLPAGVQETLFEIKEKDHPSVLRLHDAMQTWQKGLSWWQWLNWKLGVAPEVPISIEFLPGEFVDPVIEVVTATPQVSEPANSVTHQVVA